MFHDQLEPDKNTNQIQRFQEELCDAAETEGEERAALDAAYRVILDDTPALWLYEPWNLAAISRSVQPQGIAADGWWFALGDWSLVRSR